MSKRQPHKNGVRRTMVNHVKGNGRSRQTPYLLINAGPQRGKRVHTLVAEAMLGRELRDDETVEHLDGNGLNNDWRNLKVVTRAFNSYLRNVREKKARRLSEGRPALDESWMEAKEFDVQF